MLPSAFVEGAEFVADGITDIRAVKRRGGFTAHAGHAFVLAAVRERGSVKRVYGFAAQRLERQHRAIAVCRRLSIRGFLDDVDFEAFFAAADDGESLLGAPAPDGQTAGLAGWRFLYNYTRKAIRNEQLRRGALADSEDLVQQVFVEWWERVGSRDRALSAVLNRDSPEHFLLRKTVRRVLDRFREKLGVDYLGGELCP